jgi:hypothetical protein
MEIEITNGSNYKRSDSVIDNVKQPTNNEVLVYVDLCRAKGGK